MAFKMRQSKFRHVYGNPNKKDQCYDDIRITKASIDNKFCHANSKYIAICTEAAGGGSFLVLPLQRTGRVERDHPSVCGHKGAVLDVKWCPHNDDVIASSSEDFTVKVWQIPDGGLITNLTEPIVDLKYHQKRVHSIDWHPSAKNVLLSVGADNMVVLWDCGTEEVLWDTTFPDLVLCSSFNYDGTRVAFTCKNKKIYVCDARTGDTIVEAKGHEGTKPSMVEYLKDEKLFTTGFSRMSERQYALWDVNNMNEMMHMDTIDNSNGVIFPFYDQDTNMVWLAGKGDSIIRYYEVTEEEPYIHYLNLFQSKETQRGLCMMPKRNLDIMHCEIARFYRLLSSGLCEVVPFIVPRKSELFQDDLYPDTASDTPAVTADEFLEGKKDCRPVLVSLKGDAGPRVSRKEKLEKSQNLLNAPKRRTPGGPKIADKTATSNGAAAAASPPAAAHTPQPVASPEKQAAPATTPAPQHVPQHASQHAPQPAPQPAAPAGPTLPPDFDPQGLLDDIRKLKLIVKAHERRIKTLEDKIAQFEANTSEEEEAA